MTEIQRKYSISEALDYTSDELDVSPAKYEEAKQHYNAVGDWLAEDDSELVDYEPIVYPQGSFAVGTAVRPLGKDDYDVDAVCLLMCSSQDITQERLKALVGNRLKHRHSPYQDMVDPREGGNRCWTIKYADGSHFHLDVLPAIPDETLSVMADGVPYEWAKDAILFTDCEICRKSQIWPTSNPKGYIEWFKSRMRMRLNERKQALAMEKKAEIQQIQDFEARTPLQRLVQLLKRHRDRRYDGDEDKPISIIITTLAAKAYDEEGDLLDALLNAVPRMRDGIECRNGDWWIPNPVNPEENFAYKWQQRPRKQRLFFEWLNAVEQEHKDLLSDQGFEKLGEYLSESYGEREAAAAMTKQSNLIRRQGISTSSNMHFHSRLSGRFDVPHREKPIWPMSLQYSAAISGRASSRRDVARSPLNSDSYPLPKDWGLTFSASTNAPPPFDIYWQVVNTGQEAADARDLRGAIFQGTVVDEECTRYRGMHWIECFIVQNSVCVARSGEFIINVL